TPQTITAIWGTSRETVFAAGSLGGILRFDGTTWSKVFDTGGTAVNALWGTSSRDVFAAGQNGSIHRYDGTSWKALASGTASDLNAAWGSTSGKVYFAGDSGTIVAYTRADTFAPRVLCSSPADGSSGVSTGSRVIFTVSEAVDPSTVTSSGVTLTADATPVDVALSTSGNTVTLTPSSPLEPATRYTATLGVTVEDGAGNRLVEPCRVTFTTAASPGGSGGSGGSGCFISCGAVR
ncbi:MAG TPA: Ig-like domain-containing protein, partial [Deltaproteobacteria bacterium]|nr:Ig-like domain-containing protein [Deltaproteobacteria bacterium]